MDRIIDEFRGKGNGPLIILIGSLHGNEAAGIKAIEEVFTRIRNEHIDVCGRVIGIRGNIQAIEQNVRFLDYDLNRCWTKGHVNHISENHARVLFAEDREVAQLLSFFNSADGEEYSQKICVDLHTTSSENGNFIVVPEVFSDHPIIVALKLPLILDLEKHIHGTLLKYLKSRDYIAFAFEGGLMGSEVAVKLHVAGVWEILINSGAIQEDSLNGIIQIGTLLQTFAAELPHKLRVRHHYWITEEDDFRMKLGFLNFQKVNEGQIIAEDKNGLIRAPLDGLIFMPLYQQSGNDGFFIVEELDPLERILN